MIYIKTSQTKLLIIVILLFLVSVILFQKIAFKVKQQSLNLVVISIDTLRPDHMGVYGYDKNTTPNIDSWANNASLFTNLRTVIPMTNPSFSIMMTGKDPFKTRIITNRGLSVSSNNKTLAKILTENGYRTAAFTTGALDPDLIHLDQGIETQDYISFKNHYFLDYMETYYQTERENYENFLSKASVWLDQNSNKKFSLWVHLMDPHRPYQPPDDLKCRFNQKYCQYLQNKTNEQLEKEISTLQFCQNEALSKEEIERYKTLYDGGIAYSDILVGQLLDKLKEKNLDKNTLVLLYGDHGEGFDHNYYFNHREVLYDSAVKIPLIIKDPLNRLVKRYDKSLQNTDILPTLLDLLGISFKVGTFDGKNLAPSINKNLLLRFFSSSKSDFEYFTNYNFSKFAIFDGRYKFIYSLANSCLLDNQVEELYDLKNDPLELKNLVNEQKEKAAKLKEKLMEHLAPYNLPPLLRDRQLENPLNNIEPPGELPY